MICRWCQLDPSHHEAVQGSCCCCLLHCGCCSCHASSSASLLSLHASDSQLFFAVLASALLPVTLAYIFTMRIVDLRACQVAVGVDAPGQQRLACIRAGMQRLAEAGGADSAEGKRLVNEYRQATGVAVGTVGGDQDGQQGWQPPQRVASGAAILLEPSCTALCCSVGVVLSTKGVTRVTWVQRTWQHLESTTAC